MPTTLKKPCPTKPALAQLKSLNSDQLNRLQTKQQQDLDLLDDIRSFLKQRATVEKEYGQALLKLSTSYLQKKDYAVSAFELQNTNGKNLMSVWKNMLETSEVFARESLTLSDQLSAQCSEPLKQFRVLKVALLRRTVDQLKALQSDLQTNVGELVKAAKAYQDVEHETHEARMKASELDEKLKKKATGLFTSRATLEKTSQKMATKREACEVKSVSSRNEYLFALASCNAANARFWQTELLELTQQLDSDAHARMRDSMLCALRSELQLACSKQERFGRMLMDLSNVSQAYQLECFFEEYASLFTEQPTYSFEPVDGDPITHILGSEAELQAESKRLASRYVADLDAKQTLERQLRHAQQARDAQGVQSVTPNQLGSTSTDEPSAVVGTQQTTELDTRIDDLKQQVRRLGIQCCRNEAKLNLFRSTSAATIDVDEMVAKLQAELQASKPPQPPSPPATPAIRASQPPASVSPAPSATVAASAPVLASNHQRATSKTSVTSANTAYSNSTMASNDGHREAAAQNNANVTPFVTWDDEPDMDVENAQPQTQANQQTNAQTYVEFDDEDPFVVAALYDFDASNADELTVRAGERLRAVQEPTINEQGWMQVENSSGQRGIVPEAYVQFTNPDRYTQGQEQQALPEAEPVADWSNEPDYANWGDPNLSNDANSTQNASIPDIQKRSVSIAFDQYRIVRALYEYEAQSEDEINLHEGDYLLVDARTDVHADDGEATTDDDDGWWFGCLLRMSQDVLAAEGLRVPGCGVFPSLVVEPIDDSDWLELSAMTLSKDTLDSLTRRIPQLKASLALARENDAGAAQTQPDASASDPDVAPRGTHSYETTAQAPCADDGEAAVMPDEIADASANANENGNENANDNDKESDNVCNPTAASENENGNELQARTAQVNDTVDDAARPSSTSFDAASTTEPSEIHDQHENDDTQKLAFQLDEESLA